MPENKNIPALRFPGFTEPLEETTLSEITSLITKGTTPASFSKSGINYVKIECLEGKKIRKDKCLFIPTKIHLRELKRSILKEGDILFAIAGATIGKCAIVEQEILPANTNQALSIIRLKDQSHIKFIFQ